MDDDSNNSGDSNTAAVAATMRFLQIFIGNSGASQIVTGYWDPRGKLPDALAPDNKWGKQYTGDAAVKIDPHAITASQEEVLKDINAACKLTGCDEKVAILIAHAESNFHANAKARGSSAEGVFQITTDTAKNIINRILPEVLPHTAEGEAMLAKLRTSYNPDDPAENAILGTALIKYNHDKISSELGHPAEAWQDYMMHFRPATAEAIARNPATMNELLPASVTAANPAFRGMTVGQLAEAFKRKMSMDVDGLLDIARGSDPTVNPTASPVSSTSAPQIAGVPMGPSISKEGNPKAAASPAAGAGFLRTWTGKLAALAESPSDPASNLGSTRRGDLASLKGQPPAKTQTVMGPASKDTLGPAVLAS